MEAIMGCDICGQDVENSDELQKYKERAHPTGVGDDSMDNLEKPDHLGEPRESAERESPSQRTRADGHRLDALHHAWGRDVRPEIAKRLRGRRGDSGGEPTPI